MIMQAAFFKLSAIIPLTDAVRYLKEGVNSSYAKQGQAVLDMNYAAIDRGAEGLVRVMAPDAWKTAEDPAGAADEILPAFIRNVMIPMNREEGDRMPVSTFNGCEDGSFPLGGPAWEKRGIADETPQWKPENYIQ